MTDTIYGYSLAAYSSTIADRQIEPVMISNFVLIYLMADTIYGYSLAAYGSMIADRRIEPYVRALQSAIEPGDVVLDIGTGTGFFAVLACKLGASKVYAIEPEDAILVAKQVAIDNGCSDRIEFIQGLSTQIDLPERVDVTISDLRGALPLYQHHIPTIVDARHRFLAANGVQIPQRDTIWMSLISDPEFYRSNYLSPWMDAPYGCNLTANRRFVTNTWQRHRLQPSHLSVKPQIWEEIDYTTTTEPNRQSTLTWQIDRAATVDGIGAWFDTILFDGIGFSNAPDEPEYTYSNAFFPLAEPVTVAVDDRVAVTLQAKLVGADYIWSWHTQIWSGDNQQQIKAKFQQSSVLGKPISLPKLSQYSPDYVPTLARSGKIDLLVLDRISAGKSLGDIASDLAQNFPERFPDQRSALSYAAELAGKYSG